MCVQCLREFKQRVDALVNTPEGDPLIPQAREVLTLMCLGDVEYARVMKMLCIYFAECPGACDQVLMDVDRLRAQFIANGAELVVPMDGTEEQFKVKH